MIPQHIAIIMDGNRRWAKKHRLDILKGHEFAADQVLEKIVEHGAKRGIKFMTFWAFSTENWQRNKYEVEGLLQILRKALKEKIKSFKEKGVRLKVIGDVFKFPLDIQDGIKKATDVTKDGKSITVVLAVNYGGRDEILRAISNFSRESGSSSAGQFPISNLTTKNFSNYLDTNNTPDPELIIRTGGEKRLSGFLLWQSEYSELYFTDTLWPDFNATDLDLAIEDYEKRQRRFGR